MKKPCDKCRNSSTYYEYPCFNCSHNPHTDAEILEDYRRAIAEPKLDKFKDEKQWGSKEPCAYCKGEKLADLIIDDRVEKEVINIATSDYNYCPNCGRKMLDNKNIGNKH